MVVEDRATAIPRSGGIYRQLVSIAETTVDHILPCGCLLPAYYSADISDADGWIRNDLELCFAIKNVLGFDDAVDRRRNPGVSEYYRSIARLDCVVVIIQLHFGY